MLTASPVDVGSTQDFPLVGILGTAVPDSAKDAVAAKDPSGDQIAGTVWLDFVSGGGGTPGELGGGKKGLPGVMVNAVDPSGTVVASATTADNGTYVIDGLAPGSYNVGLPASNFTEPYSGVSWLGTESGHRRHHPVVRVDLGGLLDGDDRIRPVGDGHLASGGGADGWRERVAGVPSDHGAVVVPGADRGLHHAHHQRAEDLRLGLRDPTRLLPALGHGDRGAVVDRVVRRRQRSGARQRAGHPAAGAGAARS